jgi:hypothetical protein
MTTTGTDRLAVIGGLVLIVVGLGVALAAGVAHLAWALPLRDLPLRPGMVDGEVLAAAGAALVLLGRGRRRGVRPERAGAARPAVVGLSRG